MEGMPGPRTLEPDMEAQASNPSIWDVKMLESRLGKQNQSSLMAEVIIPTLEE